MDTVAGITPRLFSRNSIHLSLFVLSIAFWSRMVKISSSFGSSQGFPSIACVSIGNDIVVGVTIVNNGICIYLGNFSLVVDMVTSPE